MSSPTQVLIDTDPGTDDAIALLMALGPPRRADMDVLGITTVGGNATLSRTTRKTLAILEYAGRSDVPVARGAARPLEGVFPYAYQFHGAGGLSVRLPSPRIVPCPERAVEFLRRKLLASAERVTVLALGPLTNLAKLLRRYPEVGDRLSRLVVMGGAVGVPGNVTPDAEFNFYSDPLAAGEVLSSGLPLTLVDLRVCRQAAIGRDGVTTLIKGGKAGRLVGRILANWFKQNPNVESYYLHDPLAMAVAMEPGILTTRQGRVEVETRSVVGLGKSTHSPALGAGPAGNVEVASGVDIESFFEMFYGLLTSE